MTLQEFKRVLSNSRGFTLGEMMTVAGVISVMMAIAVPNYLAFQPSSRLNGGAREVFAKLMWSRSQAVEENTTYVITFPTNHTVQIFSDANANGSPDAGEWTETIDLQTNYYDVTLSKSGVDPTFNGRGTAGGSTTLTITNSSGSKTVTVSPTGNVKIS